MTQKEKAKLVPVSREPALLTERDADKSPVLECIDLGITFGGLKAVDNFNVTIGRTEITGLIGPNRAGQPRGHRTHIPEYPPFRRAERGRKHHRRDGHADALHDARGHFPPAPLLEGRARHA